MQNFIKSGLFLVLAVFLAGKSNGQTGQFTVTPPTQCYNTTSNYTANAALFVQVNGATHYTWTIAGPAPASFTPGQWPGPMTPAANGSQIAITATACGIYTLVMTPFNNTVSPGNPVAILAAQTTNTFEIYCPTSASVNVSNSAICIGNSAIFTGVGGGAAGTYTWSNGFQNNNFPITPSVNTCLTFTATTPQGCTVTPVAPGCVSVQAITATVSPASQTICVGSPICLTATAQAVSNSSVAPGTATTGIQWLDPNGFPLVSSCTTAATAGTYSAAITHTGAAGTCTFYATAAVVTSTNISVTASASAPSVCPGATVSLSATSIQTNAASYVWTYSTNPFGGTATQVGNPVIRNNSFATSTVPQSYTVDVNYFGCPGRATVTVGLLSLTPTLTPSSFSICANTQMTVCATGGTLFTFRYHDFSNNTSTIIGTANSVINCRSFTPTLATNQQYISVSTSSNGCTGSTTISVVTRTLYPTIVASNTAVCPGTQFTLTALNAGTPTIPGSASFTWSSSYNSNLGSPSRTLVHTPPLTNPVPQTYTVTADSAGCRGTASITINLRALNPQLTPSAYSICPGTPMTMTVSGGMDTKDSLYGLPLTPPPGSLITSATAGTAATVFTFAPSSLPQTYTVVVDSAGCRGTNTINIGLLNLGPQVSVTPTSYSMCPNTVISFTATTASGPNSYNYTFIGAGGPTSTLNLTSGNTATAQPLTLAQTYTVYADSSSCVGFTTITITERVLNPTIVSSNTYICKNQQLTVTAQGVGVSPMTTYTFGILNPSPQLLPSGGPSFSFAVHSPSVQTVYTVKVDSAGCTNNLLLPPTVTVTIRPDLVLSPSSTAASVCPGTAATLAVTSPTYVTWPVSYTWTQTAGTGSINPPTTRDTIIAFPFTPSSYSVFAVDSMGCIGSTVISVGIDPTISFPVAVSANGSTICIGQTLTLTSTATISTIGSPSLTYVWVPTTGSMSAMNNATVAVSPSVTTVYSVIVANQYGCVSGNTINIPVGTYPSTVNAITAMPSAVCVGFTSTLTAFGANSYTWTVPGSTTGVAQQSVAGGPGIYVVLMSNGGSCTSTAQYQVTQLTPQPFSLTPSSYTTCIESNFPRFSKPVKLTASGPYSNYVWFPYNPNNMTYSLGTTTDVRPAATTQYTVIGSSNACSTTQTITVIVIPQFTMTVVPPLPAMCFGDSLKLSITNIYTGPNGGAVGPVSAWTYSWTEPGNAPPISLSNNLTPTVMAFPQNTSTYSVEVRDSRKCVSLPRLVTVTVLPRPLTSIAVPTINSVATRTICYVGLNPGEKNVTLDLQAVNGNTNLQFGVVPTYTWMAPYDVKHNSILTPSNNPGITISAPVKAPSVVVYTVVSGYNGIPGCRTMDTVSIRVVDCRPVRDVKWTTTELNDTLCVRNCVTFQNLTDTMAGGPQKLEWQFPGGSPNTSNASIPTVCYNLPGKFNVILTVSNQYPTTSGGSTLTIGQLGYVKVVDVPNVMIVAPGQLKSDTTVRLGTPVRLTGSGATTYEWEPNYNITSLTNPKVTVNPFRTTQYILTGYNSKHCSSSDTINVIVIEDCGEMYVPNAFSPNNDGANDVLYVRGICLQSLTFMVFDRWGEKVFETNDQKVGWDGTYRGIACNTGVFVYRLEGKTYDGKGFSAKGNITLIR